MHSITAVRVVHSSGCSFSNWPIPIFLRIAVDSSCSIIDGHWALKEHSIFSKSLLESSVGQRSKKKYVAPTFRPKIRKVALSPEGTSQSNHASVKPERCSDHLSLKPPQKQTSLLEYISRSLRMAASWSSCWLGDASCYICGVALGRGCIVAASCHAGAASDLDRKTWPEYAGPGPRGCRYEGMSGI